MSTHQVVVTLIVDVDATNAQVADKINKGSTVELPADAWSHIVTFVDFKGLPALACVCKTTRDAAKPVMEAHLARDKATVLRCWLALGGKEDTLRRRYRDEDTGEFKARDEPSDEVSEWLGVMVDGGRVKCLKWGKAMIGLRLTGTIPAEIGALDGLIVLNLSRNQICGPLPSEIGRLTSLRHVYLHCNRLQGPLPAEIGAFTALKSMYLDRNNFTGEVPSTLANLTNVKALTLFDNNFDTGVPTEWFDSKLKVQRYFATLRPKRVEDQPS